MKFVIHTESEITGVAHRLSRSGSWL